MTEQEGIELYYSPAGHNIGKSARVKEKTLKRFIDTLVSNTAPGIAKAVNENIKDLLA